MGSESRNLKSGVWMGKFGGENENSFLFWIT